MKKNILLMVLAGLLMITPAAAESQVQSNTTSTTSSVQQSIQPIVQSYVESYSQPIIESQIQSIVQSYTQSAELLQTESTTSSIESIQEKEEPIVGNLTIGKKVIAGAWHVACDVMGNQKWVKDEISNPEGIPAREGHRLAYCGDPNHWIIWLDTTGTPFDIKEIKSGATGGTLDTKIYTDGTYTEYKNIADIKLGQRMYWTTQHNGQVWHHTGITTAQIPEFTFVINGEEYQLTANEQITISNLPVGEYEIIEKYNPNFFIASVSIPYVQNEQNDVVVKVSINENQNSIVEFINQRVTPDPPEPTPIEPPVTSEPESIVESVVESVVESIPESIESEVESTISSVQSIVESIESEVESTTSSVESIIESIESSVESVTSSVESPMESITSSVESVIESTVSSIQPVAESTVSSVQSIAESEIESVQPTPESKVESIISSIESPVESITQSTESIIESTVSSIQSIVESVQSIPESKPESIESKVESAADTPTEIPSPNPTKEPSPSPTETPTPAPQISTIPTPDPSIPVIVTPIEEKKEQSSKTKPKPTKKPTTSIASGTVAPTIVYIEKEMGSKTETMPVTNHPKTGDENKTWLWVLLVLISGIGAFYVIKRNI